MTQGWRKTEKSEDITAISEAWLKGYFQSTHYNWDGKTYSRNFAELRARDLALMSLGELKGKKVLDIGCGDGTYAYVLSKLGAIVSGQDLNVSNIERADKRLYGEANKQKGKFISADAEKLLFDSSSFDAVFSADFFEHISLEKKRKVIAEAYRVLKPGGTLVIKTPNLDYLCLSINLKRILNLLRGRSPFIYIAHTRDNPDNEHYGLTNYAEMSRELEACLFHTPIFQYHPLQRKRLSPILSKILFLLKLKFLNEHLIISTKKSIFIGVADDLS
jgi:ubiquinone/menaquinone biosynthesis C-methylase UbiE